MNLLDLHTVFRREMADTVEPYLWGDAECTEFANDALMEAVRRGLLIIDSTTTAICNIAYTTDPVLSLDYRVIAIRSALISGQSIPLERVTVDWMDYNYPGWRSTTAAIPTMYIADWGSRKIRLYPDPTTSGTVLLSVHREPTALTAFGDIPEIPTRFHRSLVHGMKYRAYLKGDTEVSNQAAAAREEAAFAAEFGERRSARNEVWADSMTGMMADTLA